MEERHPFKIKNMSKAFIKEFWKDKKMIGSILPSSKFLAAKMLNHIPLENTKLINTVLTNINKLHSHESIYVSKNEYLTELNIETNQKVIDRYNATKWNNIEIISET